VGATAVIHLGHDWASDRLNGDGPGNANLVGAELLARTAREAGVTRFVFASTTSARPQALNAYGRIKHAIEERLRALPRSEGRMLCARIGLVYGGPERAQYGLMAKLAGLPVLPMVALDREIQPIHLDEVCDGLLKLALDPPDGRPTMVLAGPTPLAFGTWLRLMRRARHGRRLMLFQLPLGLVLAGCAVTRAIPFIPTVERERVLGLAGAAPMPSAADLAALGLPLRDPMPALVACRPARRRLIAESAAMLRYVADLHSRGATIRLARALRRDHAFRHALPWPVVRWPALMRLIEPIRPSVHHGLARRLHLAAMVAEAMPTQSQRPRFRAVVGQIVLDGLALPFRLLLSGIGA
jgi:uncharacterized protein YbjT (DUF2867 family)